MATTYNWIRYIPPTSGNTLVPIIGATSSPFAVYLSDYAFGVQADMSALPTGPDVFTWRYRLSRGSLIINDVEWIYTNQNPRTLQAIAYDAYGNPGALTDHTDELASAGSSQGLFSNLIMSPPGQISIEYDANGNLSKVTDAKGQETSMTYATDGLPLTITDRNGNTSELVYDGLPFSGASRNLLQVKTPKGTDPLDGFRTVTFEYDEYDNVTSVKDQLNNEVLTAYDALDRPVEVTDPLGEVTSFNYLNTLLEGVVMPPNNGSGTLERKTTMLFDDVNRVREVKRDVDSLGAQQTRVKYAYTGFSQLAALTRIKNGVNKSFAFSYDQLGRQTSTADPLATPGVSTMSYMPFCVGNASTSARGIRRKTGFDNRCLLTQVEVGDVDSGDPLEVLNPREIRQWEHDQLGRMVKSSQTRSAKYSQSVFGIDVYGGQAEERLYLYNELDRLVKLTFEDGSTMEWEHDEEGNVTKMTDPAGKVTEYTYFRDNLLKEVRIKRPSQSDRVFSYSYDLAGRMLAIAYPTGTGIVAKFDDGSNTPGSGWDAKGQLLHLRYEKNGTLIRRFQFSYDESGNRASQLDVTPTKAIKWEYTYDWLDRLEVVRRLEVVAGLGGIVNLLPLSGVLPIVSVYSYDASDNRKTYRDEVANRTYRYVVDDADNLTQIYLTDGSNPEVLLEVLVADQDGNLMTRTDQITGEVTTFSFDDFDRLARVSSSTSGRKQDNRYDVSGIRKRKLDGSGNSSREFTAGISTSTSKAGTSSSSAPAISYLMGHQLMGAEVNGAFQFWLGDALGTVRDIVNDTGAVIRSMEFQEHGQLLFSSGTGTFAPKIYQGGLSVNDDRNDSGLYLMGHRHFDSELGRFISRDPIGFKGGFNLFSGHGTSPVTMVDPWGLQPSGKVLLYCPHGTGNIDVDDLETSVRLHGLDFEITKKHPGFLGYKNGTQAIEVTFRKGIRMNGPEMLLGESKRGRVLLFPDSVKKYLDNRRRDGSCPSPMTDAAALANIMTYNIKHEVLVHHTGNFIERGGRRSNVVEDHYDRDASVFD